MSVTLEQLLQSRDKRARHQRDLLGENPGKSLLCLTVQLPGSVKRNDWSLAIAKAGVDAIRDVLNPEYEELLDLETGYEGYFLVPMDPLEAKRRTCQLEDTHPLGRLMDIDVLVMPGTDRASAKANGIGKIIFPDGTGKTNFPEAIANPTHADASVVSAGPTASENYFSGRYPKSQFPDAIANPTHADTVIPVGREEIGLAARRCLLCGQPARVCMRARAHTQEELLAKIEEMVKSYLKL